MSAAACEQPNRLAGLAGRILRYTSQTVYQNFNLPKMAEARKIPKLVSTAIKPTKRKAKLYMPVRIHPTADVSDRAEIGEGTSIWHHCQVREGVHLGKNCILGKGVYIDAGVSIGDNVKIQNYVSVYHGVTVEDGVFIGPHVCFTNDLRPRAINPDGSLKAADDWVLTKTRICQGAALGANSTVVCGVTVGAWAMVGSGSVVSRDVPPHGIVFGNPARLRGFVCACGAKLARKSPDSTAAACPECGREVLIPIQDWEKIR
jgi:acetyltransferase-like isoleucine patch superfamily enzyme